MALLVSVPHRPIRSTGLVPAVARAAFYICRQARQYEMRDASARSLVAWLARSTDAMHVPPSSLRSSELCWPARRTHAASIRPTLLQLVRQAG